MIEPAGEPTTADRSKLLERAQSLLDRLTLCLNTIGTITILALTVLISADIAGRLLFNAPISGVPELVSLSIVAIVFLQIGQAMRAGRLTRTEALLTWVGKRAPRLRALIESIYNLLAGALIWFLFQASYPLFLKAWARNTYIGSVGDFTAPVWPVNS